MQFGTNVDWADVEISPTESAPERLSIDSGRQILLVGTTGLSSWKLPLLDGDSTLLTTRLSCRCWGRRRYPLTRPESCSELGMTGLIRGRTFPASTSGWGLMIGRDLAWTLKEVLSSPWVASPQWCEAEWVLRAEPPGCSPPVLANLRLLLSDFLLQQRLLTSFLIFGWFSEYFASFRKTF